MGVPFGAMVSYERSIGEWGLRGGIGAGFTLVSDNRADVEYILSVEAAYLLNLGSRSSKLEFGGGMMAMVPHEPERTLFSETDYLPAATIGYRLQPVGGGMGFRVAATRYGDNLWCMALGVGVGF